MLCAAMILLPLCCYWSVTEVGAVLWLWPLAGERFRVFRVSTGGGGGTTYYYQREPRTWAVMFLQARWVYLRACRIVIIVVEVEV